MNLAASVTRLDVSPQFARRLLYVINRWTKSGFPDTLSAITESHFRQYRRGQYSPATIESDISDIIYIAAKHGITIPRGRRLRIARPRPSVPSLETLSALYKACESAVWPRRSWCPPAAWWRCLLVVCCWTGLRRGDIQRLTWSQIGTDRITVTAAKTGSTHEIPMIRTVERHLATIKGGPDRVFDLPQSCSFRRWRQEMHQIAQAANVQPITWKQMRQFAITSWSMASAEAGRIVHGCGLGVMDHYLDRYRVLEDAMPLVRLPDAFLTASERSAARRGRDELVRLFSRADAKEKKLILDVARKVAK